MNYGAKAKLQLLVFISLDSYLLDKTVPSPLWNNPNKYGITKKRTRATQALGWNVSFISLVQWEKEENDTDLIEAVPETISVIGSMFKYWLVDEIILFVVPRIQRDGLRLFTEIPGPSSWKMIGSKCFTGWPADGLNSRYLSFYTDRPGFGRLVIFLPILFSLVESDPVPLVIDSSVGEFLSDLLLDINLSFDYLEQLFGRLSY